MISTADPANTKGSQRKQLKRNDIPASYNLLITRAKDAAEWEKWSQNVDVPIDDVKAIKLQTGKEDQDQLAPNR